MRTICSYVSFLALKISRDDRLSPTYSSLARCTEQSLKIAPTSMCKTFLAPSSHRGQFRVINFAQTPSSHAARKCGPISPVTQMRQNLFVRQRFKYFRVIAIFVVVTAALCWGLAHI
jgi:hypothetical protein